MLRRCLYLLFLSSLYLDFVVSQHSDAGFAYGGMPMRPPIIPERTRPIQVVRPITARPRRPLPSQGGSRYLRRRKPGKKNLDKSLLMQLMGDDYQTSWMSDEKPQKLLISVPSNEVDLDGIPGRWAQERLFEQTRELNLTAELSTLEPELLPYQDIIKSWLLKRSSCPVEFTWKDLGPTFWPRWVRKGECMDRKGSCSFPTGMHCVPAATTTVHILRWQCRDRKMTVVKKSASGSKTSDEVLQKRRARARKTPNARTLGEVKYRRRVAERLAPNTESADEVMYRRRVADISPEQQRRKRRCDWFRVPFPITIDCFCTC